MNIAEILLGVFFLICLIQLYYLVFPLAKLSFYKPPVERTEWPAVSIVVAARNEEKHLNDLLETLHSQVYPHYEVVVINDRSIDDTEDILSAYKLKWPSLKLVLVDHVPDHLDAKKYALTLGIKSATHDILLLIDADCRPSGQDWVRYMVGGYTDHTNIVLGFSSYASTPGLLNLFIRYETLFTAQQYLGFALSGKPYMGVGRNLSYRKSFFMAQKGFNGYQKILGGDDDLFVNKNANKQNAAVIVGKEASTRSEPKKTLSEFYRQKKRHLSVGKLYRAKDRFRLGLLALSQILFWILGISLLIANVWPLWVAGAMVLRFIVGTIVFQRIVVKLGERFPWGLWVFLDFLYLFYYISAGGLLAVTKKVTWK